MAAAAVIPIVLIPGHIFRSREVLPGRSSASGRFPPEIFRFWKISSGVFGFWKISSGDLQLRDPLEQRWGRLLRFHEVKHPLAASSWECSGWSQNAVQKTGPFLRSQKLHEKSTPTVGVLFSRSFWDRVPGSESGPRRAPHCQGRQAIRKIAPPLGRANAVARGTRGGKPRKA